MFCKVACFTVVLAALPAFAQQGGNLGTSFLDEFDSLDSDRWNVANFAAFADWLNCANSKRNVALEDGFLRLSYSKDPTFNRDYACAAVHTNKKHGYGTYEARLKTDRASGLNMNFFTYTGPTHKDKHDEIDFEILTKNPSLVSTNTYVDGEPQNGALIPLDPPADAAFHVYSFEWTPDAVRWYVDGVKMAESEEGSVVPSAPQLIFLTVWGTETLNDWMGPFDGIDAPKVMEVDWVVYTASGEKCQHPDSVVCQGG